jgi:putative oxygen-independent coproporphyrinogen III oxidase
MTELATDFGVYIHWPFCQSKCPYCDFNSHVREAVDQRRWRDALLRELAHFAALTPGRRVDSIFFGGGTPSLMEPDTAGALIAAVKRHWATGPDLEITLEANPSTVETARFAAFRDAGVNRVSIGVQALDDDALRFLGRGHDRAQAIAAVETAARLFDRYSFDLIYARPGHSVAAWRAELAEGLALARGHLSVYQLTIEPGTAFEGAVRRGEFAIPDEDTGADLYETTQEMLAAAGLPAYEISNHAAPGQDCRHNLVYWRYGDYFGVGPGAHGRITVDGVKHATRQHRAPEPWLERVDRAGHASRTFEPIPPAEQAMEALMMGLRLTEGIDAARFEAATGVPLAEAVDAEGVARLADAGFVEWSKTRLRPTADGLQRLDAVLAMLVRPPHGLR